MVLPARLPGIELPEMSDLNEINNMLAERVRQWTGPLFSFAKPLSKRLGESGMGVITRVMGMLDDGLKALFPAFDAKPSTYSTLFGLLTR